MKAFLCLPYILEFQSPSGALGEDLEVVVQTKANGQVVFIGKFYRGRSSSRCEGSPLSLAHSRQGSCTNIQQAWKSDSRRGSCPLACEAFKLYD